ncbi:MAG: Ig-like domain-containing protein, partial [Fidelibacterota bacterium]
SGLSFCIDPGHGYNANWGVYGYPEAYRNLDIALMLEEYLASANADTVILTRRIRETNPSLSEREDIANSNGVSWFHSIHSNAGLPPQYNYVLVLLEEERSSGNVCPNTGYPMGTGQAEWPGQTDVISDTISDWIARGYRIPSQGGFLDWTFYGGCNGGFSLGVLNDLLMPGQLSEGGFHTNPRQNLHNMNMDSKRLEARGIYISFLRYFDQPLPSFNTLVGNIYDEDSGHPINGATVSLSTGQIYITDTYESVFSEWCDPEEECANGFYYFDNVSPGEYTLSVSAEGFYDTTMSVTVVDSFYSFYDVHMISTIPPKVVETYPLDGDTSASITGKLLIKFSRRMNTESVDTSIVIEPAVEGTIFWTENDHVLNLKYRALLPFDTWFAVTIPGTAVDPFAHQLDGNGDGVGGDSFSFSFKTTATDRFPAIFLYSYPTDSAGVDVYSAFSVIYNEPLDVSSINANRVYLVDENQETVESTLKYYQVDQLGIITLFPDNPLNLNQFYLFYVGRGIEDLYGNATTRSFTYSFTTIDTLIPFVTAEGFEFGLDNWIDPSENPLTKGVDLLSISFFTEDSITYLTTKSKFSAGLSFSWDPGVPPDSSLLYLNLHENALRRIPIIKGGSIKAFVFGDGGGNLLRFQILEMDGTSRVSDWIKIDWPGWREIKWELKEEGTGEWFESHAGIGDTVYFSGFQLSRGNEGEPDVDIYFDDIRIEGAVTAIREMTDLNVIPENFELMQNYPNPFNPSTFITVRLPGADEKRSANPGGPSITTLRVYNILGQQIKTLYSGAYIPGVHSFIWDGKDSDGKDVSSGIYFYKFDSPYFSGVKKMLLIR